MELRIARIISYTFHPLLMPIYTLLTVFSLNVYISTSVPVKAKWMLVIMMLSATVFIPLTLFAFLKRRKLIRSYQMETREERMIPFILMTIIYFLLYQLFVRTQLPGVYALALLSATVLGLVLTGVNFRWKISAHMAGIGGIAGFLTGLSYRLAADLHLLIFLWIMIAGLVGFSRLKQNAHKPSEVYSGFLAGAAVFLILTLLL